MDQSDQINALRHRFDLGQYYENNSGEGWLSTLVWNVRNNYCAWPDGKIQALTVKMLVEGFLAEIEEIKKKYEQ